ncbi:PmoA family protein [Egicoccus sp. AB-alg2]|uniref:DUF6807 domain-containing protein n=1 Tax=Egicoccus sp. AB-alg2 TaxID=3242693 RepID=UPI00359E168E
MTSTRAPVPDVLARLTATGRGGAELRSGNDTAPEWSPRPYLHPVTTPAGVVVTDTHPEDHRWHLGASVTLQDVGGVNFWGGRTYLRDRGYTWRDDHGHVAVDALTADERRLEAEFRWVGPDGRGRLREQRHLEVRESHEGAWRLGVTFALHNTTDADLPLGSPATNGRVGAGYGGFFWRLPTGPEPVRVRTPAAEGEQAVHGSVADWVAAHGSDTAGRRWTVAVVAMDEVTRADPWFVRVAGYPGVCSALAFVDPVVLTPGAVVQREFEVLVADGWRLPDGTDEGR